MPNYVAGLDLAQSSDWTALVVAEHLERAADVREYVPPIGSLSMTTRVQRCVDVFHVVHLQRWRGSAYQAIVEDVCALLGRPPLRGQVSLTLDATGVGRPVLDLFEQAVRDGKLDRWPKGITITAGAQETHEPAGAFHNLLPGCVVRVGPGRLVGVPKHMLVQRLEVLLQAARLRVADGLALAPALKAELLNFQAHAGATGHVRFEAGGELHDDLVLASALAVYQEPDRLGIPGHIDAQGQTWPR